MKNWKNIKFLSIQRWIFSENFPLEIQRFGNINVYKSINFVNEISFAIIFNRNNYIYFCNFIYLFKILSVLSMKTVEYVRFDKKI